jgi:hypothetical protein
MRKDGLASYYDRLTPEERFKLFIEAWARGDEGECRHLESSCPKRTYEMDDVAYLDRVKASEELTTIMCLDLAPRLAKVQMLAAFKDSLPFIYKACVDEENPDREKTSAKLGGLIEVANVLDKVRRDIVRDAGAMWFGFSNFSSTQLGIEPKKLAKVWFAPALEEVEFLESFMADEPDWEKVSEYEAILAELWHRLVEAA